MWGERVLKLVDAPGVDVKRDFIERYGGSEKNWQWLHGEVRKQGPLRIKEACARIRIGPATHRLALGPCAIYGDLLIADELLWAEAIIDGELLMKAVVHREREREHFDALCKLVPPNDQREEECNENEPRN